MSRNEFVTALPSILLGALLGAAVVAAVIWAQSKSRDDVKDVQTRAEAVKAEAAKYKLDHKCVREGFAGRNAEPYYKCDTGLILEHEMSPSWRP